MTVCERCGSALDPTDAFCGVCGGFAAWADAEAPAEPEPVPAGEKEPAAEANNPAAAKPAAEANSPAAAKPTAVQPGVPVTERAEADNPAAVQPAVPVIDRAPVRPAETGYVAAPDDVLCAACQTSNPSSRKFCRRCGAGLFRLVPSARRSWWRRLLERFARWRRRRRLARKRGRLRTVLRLVVVLAVCAGIGVGADRLLHHSSSVTNNVRSHFAAPKPVNPRSATASSTAPGHPAGSAVDGASNTWWSPAVGSAGGQWLQAEFAGSHTLLDVDVMIGASQEQNAFLLQARPAALLLTAKTSTGATVTDRLALADKTGFQQFKVLIPQAVSVRLTIESADGAGPGRLTALAEVEFFADS